MNINQIDNFIKNGFRTNSQKINMNNSEKKSNERKLIDQIGIFLMAIGAIIFIIAFITSATSIGGSESFDSFEQSTQSVMYRSVGGVIFIIVGMILRGLGRGGVADSGFMLDTERERKDLKPINRMFGSQLNEVLEEVDLKRHLDQNPIIKIKCQSCKHLNDEHDKFCSGCGKEI